MGFLIGILVFGFIGFWFVVIVVTASSVSSDEKKAKQALEKQSTLNAEFFSGKQTVVFETPGNYLPPKLVIEAAPNYGYRLISQSEGNYGSKTLVFEKIS